MKIKDILSEGFWQGAKEFGAGALAALPSASMQAVLSNVKKAPGGKDLTDLEAAQAAYNKFGDAPARPKDSPFGFASGKDAWLTDKQLQARIDAAKEKKLKNKQEAQKFAKKTAQLARTAMQQPASPADMPSAGAGNIPQGYRITVQNPQKNATFYKYPDGRWTDEYGNVMPSGAHGALEQFADTAGRMEQMPQASTPGVRGFKRGARRAR